MVQDVIRQGISPATGADQGSQAVTDFNHRVDGALNIPNGEVNTLNGAKDRPGYIRLTENSDGDFIFHSYANGKWTEYIAVLDGLKSIGGITLDENNVTVISPVKWRINSINYEKSTNTVLTVMLATDGNKRIDYIYADTNGNILLIEGTEVPDGNPYIPPTLPNNTILVAPVYISGSAIEPPKPDLTGFLTKAMADGLYAPIRESLNYVQINPTVTQEGMMRLRGNIETEGDINALEGVTRLGETHTKELEVLTLGGGNVDTGLKVKNGNFGFGKATLNFESGTQTSSIYLGGQNYNDETPSTLYFTFNGEKYFLVNDDSITNVKKLTGSELFPITDPKDYVQAGTVDDFTPTIMNIHEGDSITDTNPATGGFVTNYPNILDDISSFFKTSPKLNVAKAGDTIAQYLSEGEYASQIYPYRPKKSSDIINLFFRFGINDLVTRTPQQVYNDLKTAWAQAKADGFFVFAHTITPIVNTEINNKAYILNDLIRSDKSLYYRLVDLGSAFSGINPSDPNYYYPDGVHPNYGGSLIYAKEVLNTLNKTAFGDKLTANIVGLNDGSNLNNNITGSAQKWSNKNADFTQYGTGDIAWIVAQDMNGLITAWQAYQVQAFLGYGNAIIGNSALGNIFARFGHKDFNISDSQGAYGFIQSNDGTIFLKGTNTLIGAVSGGYVKITDNNVFMVNGLSGTGTRPLAAAPDGTLVIGSIPNQVQNSLTPSSTILAPSVDAVNTALGKKANLDGGNNFTGNQFIFGNQDLTGNQRIGGINTVDGDQVVYSNFSLMRGNTSFVKAEVSDSDSISIGLITLSKKDGEAVSTVQIIPSASTSQNVDLYLPTESGSLTALLPSVSFTHASPPTSSSAGGKGSVWIDPVDKTMYVWYMENTVSRYFADPSF